MALGNKNIYVNIYVVTAIVLLLAGGVVYRLLLIQGVEGSELRQKARSENRVKEEVIEANRGNVYSADGSLLATSVPVFEIRFDGVAPKQEVFEKEVKLLADSLAVMFNKPSSYYESMLRKGRASKSRYILIARNLSYVEYVRIKNFPLFKKKEEMVEDLYLLRRQFANILSEELPKEPSAMSEKMKMEPLEEWGLKVRLRIISVGLMESEKCKV